MKREDVFERLDPPPGGLARLRERLDPSSNRRFAPLALVFAIAALLLVLVWSSVRAPNLVAEARQAGSVEAVALGLAPPSGETAAVQQRTTTALTQVRTTNPAVAFYWVGSTASAN